jgi:3-deoxy-D-manno-octulosonic-acid transferase
VGAISEDDAARLREQGVPAERIIVTGDTRYDQVWKRAQAASSSRIEALRADGPTVVAGSTWPADQAPLLAAWVQLKKQIRAARLIIAPHELTPHHLRSVSDWASSNSLRLARTSASPRGHADVVLVDQYGILGDLYTLADVAYVGGGFHAAGLHSVLEPAAFGAPVIFGPNYKKSREAGALLQHGGAYVVNSADEMKRKLVDLLGSKDARNSAGSAAKAVVERGLGAAERSFELVRALLGP